MASLFASCPRQVLVDNTCTNSTPVPLSGRFTLQDMLRSARCPAAPPLFNFCASHHRAAHRHGQSLPDSSHFCPCAFPAPPLRVASDLLKQGQPVHVPFPLQSFTPSPVHLLEHTHRAPSTLMPSSCLHPRSPFPSKVSSQWPTQSLVVVPKCHLSRMASPHPARGTDPPVILFPRPSVS